MAAASPKHMAEAPVGIMDSGVGGLAIYRTLRAELPAERFIYFADSAHCPYGSLSDDALDARIDTVAAQLVARGVKAIVVACNTATVRAVARLRALYSLPIVGIEPGIKPAAAASKTRKAVLLATPKTISSQSVARLHEAHGADLELFRQPCPGLVEAVEAGDLTGAHVRSLLSEFLNPVTQHDADVVILGCTHFIFLETTIRELLGSSVTVLEPSFAVARQLHRRLNAEHLMASRRFENDVFLTSGADHGKLDVVARGLLDHHVSFSSTPG